MEGELQIRFLKREGGYQVYAECSTGGEGDEPLRLPFGADEVESAVAERVRRSTEAVYGPHARHLMTPRSLELLATPESAAESNGGPAGDSDYLAELGAELFDALFHGDVRDLYRDNVGDGLRVRLSFDLDDPFQSALARLPWECMKAERSPVSFLSTDIASPVIRHAPNTISLRQPPLELPLKILIVTANPSDTKQLNLRREDEVIDETFGALEAADPPLVELTRLFNASYDDLDECLSEGDFHVLHYMGHGDYEDGLGVLVLESGGVKELIDGPTLADLLKQQTDKHLRFVFMNACNTGVEGGGADPFGGVATAVLDKGIPAVIGMQHQIEDDAAVEFASGLYSQIVKGEPVDRAVSTARRKVLQKEGGARRDTNFWLTPVLYMRKGVDGVLFRQADEPSRGVAEAAPVAPAAAAAPDPSEPPADAEAGEGPVLWLSRFGEEDPRVVLNWRPWPSAGPGDRIALFREPPSDPDAYVGDNWAYVMAEDERRLEASGGSQLVSDASEDDGPFWIAYLRENEDWEFEIAASYPRGEA